MACPPGPHPHPDRRQYVPKTTARGFTRCKDLKSAERRIVVSFDPDTFDQISAKAERDKQSFAAAVRDLVEWGLAV